MKNFELDIDYKEYQRDKERIKKISDILNRDINIEIYFYLKRYFNEFFNHSEKYENLSDMINDYIDDFLKEYQRDEKSEKKEEKEEFSLINLKILLSDSYISDKDIDIIFDNEYNEIMIEINEKYHYRELRLFLKNENLYINDFSFDNDDNKEIELFKINYSIYLNQLNKLYLMILNYIRDFIDIIE
jgi:hypothetical protein